jgi:DNA-binding winged helix-turn-helix (wHTH) protein
MLTWLWTRLSDGGPQVSISGRALRRFPDRAVERLLRARVLIEHPKADSWSVCAHCECGLDVRPIRQVDSELRACCPHDAAEDVVLEPDDLRRFGIDADNLISAMAASAGFPAAATVVADGLWLLGRLPTGICVFVCRDADLLMAPATMLTAKMAAGSAPITVIAAEVDPATELHLRAAGIEARSLAECVLVDEHGMENIAFDRLSPIAVTAPRLVLNRSRQSVVLDGRRLDLTPQMFALIRLFAEQAGQRDPLLRKETIDARTGRPANEIVRDLRKALVGCGLSRSAADALIVTVRGYGYRLGIAPAEVAVED